MHQSLMNSFMNHGHLQISRTWVMIKLQALTSLLCFLLLQKWNMRLGLKMICMKTLLNRPVPLDVQKLTVPVMFQDNGTENHLKD
jgi:hypothetical protein